MNLELSMATFFLWGGRLYAWRTIAILVHAAAQPEAGSAPGVLRTAIANPTTKTRCASWCAITWALSPAAREVSMNKPLKAYHVGENCEGGQVIVFATNSATARREGGNELGLSFEEVDFCRRARHFDQYAGQPFIPAKAYHDAGWWVSCWGCEEQLYADSEDEDGNPRSMVYDRSVVYCGQSCKDAMQQRIDDANAKGEAFKHRVSELRPDLTFTEWCVGWPNITQSARFSFPGSKYGGSVRDQDGDGNLEWYIKQGDLDAWNTYQQERANRSTGGAHD